MEEVTKHILEDEQQGYKIIAMLAPLHRTPFSKEDGRAIKQYTQRVNRALDELTPWKSSGAGLVNRAAFDRAGAKPGEIVVLLDGSDSAKNPVYKDAKVGKGD